MKTPQRRKYAQRTIIIAHNATLLHLAGHCGVAPANPPKNFICYKITTNGNRMTFHYVNG